MSIPLPAAGFVYSLLKDAWGWGLAHLRGRRLPHAEAFQRWTVDEWYHPYLAVEEFGNRDWLRDRKEAQHRQDKVAVELTELVAKGIVPYPLTWSDEPEVTEAKERSRKLDEQYKHVTVQIEALTDLIHQDLEWRLAAGELVARGCREPFGGPYLTISRHEWQVLKLELPACAKGGGVSYIGLTIGKPGTKRLFRRGR